MPDAGQFLLIVWFLACAAFGGYHWYKDNHWNPDPKDWDRLMQDKLPPMKGLQRNDKGEWERF